MKPHIIAFYIFIGIVVIAQLKGCVDCYSDGGTPVRGVFNYACIKN